jgi:hypothetical protein
VTRQPGPLIPGVESAEVQDHIPGQVGVCGKEPDPGAVLLTGSQVGPLALHGDTARQIDPICAPRLRNF